MSIPKSITLIAQEKISALQNLYTVGGIRKSRLDPRTQEKSVRKRSSQSRR
jgi:hypothetical protein